VFLGTAAFAQDASSSTAGAGAGCSRSATPCAMK
jgi:hypothetical protein